MKMVLDFNTTDNNGEKINVSFNVTPKKMVCPFRTCVVITQKVDDNDIPSQIQNTTYPECHYEECPWYDIEKNTCNRCINGWD